jgi:large subunit ribosomal protein L9
MKVLLRKDVRGIGRRMEIREVSDGYARNYLIPRGLAEPATGAALALKQAALEGEALRDAHTRGTKERLKRLTLRFPIKASSKGDAFGSITDHDIERALEQEDLPGVKVLEPKHLKALGEHLVILDLGSGARGEVKVILERIEEKKDKR